MSYIKSHCQNKKSYGPTVKKSQIEADTSGKRYRYVFNWKKLFLFTFTETKPKNVRRKVISDDSWTSDDTVLKGWMQKTVKIGNNRTFQWFLVLSSRNRNFETLV